MDRDSDVSELTTLRELLRRAYTAALGTTLRTPLIPGPAEHARPWHQPMELCSPPISRSIVQIRRFEESGQSLEINTRRWISQFDRSILVDWNSPEAANLKLPAIGIAEMSEIAQDRLKTEDVNSFTMAVYTSVIVTAMECIRIIQGKDYDKSSRFTRNFETCAARGALWDILLLRSPTRNVPKKHDLAIICLPPWSFSKLDMEELATPGSFPAGTLDLLPNALRVSNSIILWAVIHDACKNSRCRYFIVTTYDYWIFGNISDRGTIAAVSPVFDFAVHNDTLRTPNLLQLVTYWGLLALGTEKDWKLPE